MYAQKQQAYAPTPYSYTPTSTLSATISLDEVRSKVSQLVGFTTDTLKEVKLSTSSAERDLYESLAEIYSILVTLDALEKAYLKGLNH